MTTRPMMTRGLSIGDTVTVTQPNGWHAGRRGSIERFRLDGDVAVVRYATIGHSYSGDPFAHDHDSIVELSVPTSLLARI